MRAAEVSAVSRPLASLPGAIGVSVVIPTHDRPDALRRCVEAVLAQDVEGFEIVIANDGTMPVPQDVRDDARVAVLDGPFGGPAAARNAAIRHAKGDLIAFTDDDTIPEPGWLRAAMDALSTDRSAVGMVGRVDCPPYDPVFEHAVHSQGVGNFLTCNAVYRRWALDSVGGFDEAFPYPHCEDRDLGYRLSRLGTISYCPAMRVVHPARPVRLLDAVRRGRFVASEWRLHRKHPQSRPPRWSVRWGPVIRHAQAWCQLASSEAVFNGSPLRAVRFVRLAGGEVAVATWMTLTGWSTERAIPVSDSSSSDGLRVAYIGPCPSLVDRNGGCAWPVLQGLSEFGCEIDCYVVAAPDEVPAELYGVRGLRVVCVDTGWRQYRWYSKSSITRCFSGNLSVAVGRLRRGSLLEENHRARGYDVVYQFSSSEAFGLASRKDRLPPVVLHPQPGPFPGKNPEPPLSAEDVCRAVMAALREASGRTERFVVVEDPSHDAGNASVRPRA